MVAAFTYSDSILDNRNSMAYKSGSRDPLHKPKNGTQRVVTDSADSSSHLQVFMNGRVGSLASHTLLSTTTSTAIQEQQKALWVGRL
jgi:hypothetical protein